MTYRWVAIAIGLAVLMGGAFTGCGGGSDHESNVTTTVGATAATATLGWDPIADPNVQGYKVYYGIQSRSYSKSVDAGRSTAQTIANLDRGTTYYFAVTAYNSGGIESGYSGEVSITP